jgi:thiol-disulfide isomerase/thioredoxin
MSWVGVTVLVVVLLVVTSWGLLRRRRAGVLRDSRTLDAPLTPADLGVPLGARATLVQFSSAFCRPCVATRQVLGAAASTVPGVAHVEVDAESHLELVRRLNVSATPTTLLLDDRGVEQRRAGGVPRKHEVLAALAEVIEA